MKLDAIKVHQLLASSIPVSEREVVANLQASSQLMPAHDTMSAGKHSTLLGSTRTHSTDPLAPENQAPNPRARTVTKRPHYISSGVSKGTALKLQFDSDQFEIALVAPKEGPEWLANAGRSEISGHPLPPAELWRDSGFVGRVALPFMLFDHGGEPVKVEIAELNKNGAAAPMTSVWLSTTDDTRDGLLLHFEPSEAGEYVITLKATALAKKRYQGQGPGELVREIRVEVTDELPPLLDTPVWLHENRATSGDSGAGTTMSMTLPLPAGARVLRGFAVEVTGQFPFEPGRGPLDANIDSAYVPMALHDSFTQAMAYRSAVAVAQYYSSLGLPTSWSDLIASAGHRRWLKLQVNTSSRANASNRSHDDTISFGTADGTVDYGADGDAVAHEMGHALRDRLIRLNEGGAGGPLKEGFADLIAALVFRDSEIAESLGTNRDLSEKARVDSTDDEAHDRGRVYGGFLWSMLDSLDQSIPTARAAALSPGALERDLGRIAFTFPTLLATHSPTSVDVVVSVLRSVSDLAAAGALESAANSEDSQKLANDLAARVWKQAVARQLIPKRVAKRHDVKAALDKLAQNDPGWLVQLRNALAPDCRGAK